MFNHISIKNLIILTLFVYISHLELNVGALTPVSGGISL